MLVPIRQHILVCFLVVVFLFLPHDIVLPPSRWHICSAAPPPLLKPSLCPPHVLHLPGNGVTQVTKKETMVTMATPSPRCLGAKLCGEKCEASCARIYTHACKIGFLASSWKRWHGNTLLLAGLRFSPHKEVRTFHKSLQEVKYARLLGRQGEKKTRVEQLN